MKKVIYLSIGIILFLVHTGFGQKIRTLFYDDILYGKVKQVVERHYTPGAIGVEFTDTTIYDEKGNTLETRRRTRHGSYTKDRYIDKSDADEKKMEIVGNEKDQDLGLKFNSKGNLDEYYSHFKNGQPNFKSTYKYDNKNNLVEFQYFDKNGKLTVKRTYKYNSDDLLMEEENWDADPQYRYHVDVKYTSFDKMGNWTNRVSNKKLTSGAAVSISTILREVFYY